MNRAATNGVTTCKQISDEKCAIMVDSNPFFQYSQPIDNAEHPAKQN